MQPKTLIALAVGGLLSVAIAAPVHASKAQETYFAETPIEPAPARILHKSHARPTRERETPQMTKNADGSVILYVGPKAPEAPEGLENNWIPTVGKAPYLMFRFYGPEEAFSNKSFKLADVELVE